MPRGVKSGQKADGHCRGDDERDIQDLHLDGFAGKVAYAQLLHDASEVAVRTHGDTLTLRLPVVKPNVPVPVVELYRR